MAIKDWKKTMSGKILTRYKHKEGIADLSIQKRFAMFSPKIYWEVTVEVLKLNYRISAEQSKFITKSKALAYAKSYMRTH